MTVNRGKDFERVIKESFEKVPNVAVARIHDQMNGFAGSANPCDFIIYNKPYLYPIECKSVHGNTLSFGNITRNQWKGLLDMSEVQGVISGVICWWVDHDVTKFIPIKALEYLARDEHKSLRYDAELPAECKCELITIEGKKKRVFFEYDMDKFLKESRISYEMHNPTDIPRRAGIWPK